MGRKLCSARLIYKCASDLTNKAVSNILQLIIQMYQPGAGSKVSRAQETLQRLQRSPEGWQLAQGLLGSKEETVRFFGALTFIVKLNTDSLVRYPCS